jgi:hypothetical protein
MNADAGSERSNQGRSGRRQYASIKRRIRERIRAKTQAKHMSDTREKFARSGILRFLFLALALQAVTSARAASKWEQPAEELAEKIARVLGSGQAQLTVNNRSTLATTELPVIRRILEQDLRAHGVSISGAESANQIRITLSENARERLWVAEIVEGSQTRVAMVHVDRDAIAAPVADAGMVLEKKRVWNSLEAVRAPLQEQDSIVLAALETKAALVILEQEDIVIYAMTAIGWSEEKRLPLGTRRPSSRDAHGLLISTADSYGFTAYAAGTECKGSYALPQDNRGAYGEWTVHCHDSDDPWPITTSAILTAPVSLSAFYNSGRNFFTGIVTPAIGVDIPPFYSIALIPRPTADHAALLLNGIDGKVQLAEAGVLKQVSGTRDWGSDFAAVRTSCGTGTQVIASSSGEAVKDSLRAYEITRQEAIAASAPLETGGTVTALWTASDGASAWAVVRKSTVEYEVDRVTALCP